MANDREPKEPKCEKSKTKVKPPTRITAKKANANIAKHNAELKEKPDKLTSKFFIKAPAFDPEDDEDEPMDNTDAYNHDKQESDNTTHQNTVNQNTINQAILTSLNKLTDLMTENNDNTKRMLNKNSSQMEQLHPISNHITDNISITNPLAQYNTMTNAAIANQRINNFSKDLSKELEVVHEIQNKDITDKKNKDFLKIMSQNIARVEAIATNNENKLKQVTKENEENKKLIENLKNEIININKECNHNKQPQRFYTPDPGFPPNRKQLTDNNGETTEDDQPFQKVQKKEKRKKKKIPVINLSPTDNTTNDDDIHQKTPPMAYAKVLLGHKPKPPPQKNPTRSTHQTP